jgi:hypothetical protein
MTLMIFFGNRLGQVGDRPESLDRKKKKNFKEKNKKKENKARKKRTETTIKECFQQN